MDDLNTYILVLRVSERKSLAFRNSSVIVHSEMSNERMAFEYKKKKIINFSENNYQWGKDRAINTPVNPNLLDIVTETVHNYIDHFPLSSSFICLNKQMWEKNRNSGSERRTERHEGDSEGQLL